MSDSRNTEWGEVPPAHTGKESWSERQAMLRRGEVESPSYYSDSTGWTLARACAQNIVSEVKFTLEEIEGMSEEGKRDALEALGAIVDLMNEHQREAALSQGLSPGGYCGKRTAEQARAELEELRAAWSDSPLHPVFMRRDRALMQEIKERLMQEQQGSNRAEPSLDAIKARLEAFEAEINAPDQSPEARYIQQLEGVTQRLQQENAALIKEVRDRQVAAQEKAASIFEDAMNQKPDVMLVRSGLKRAILPLSQVACVEVGMCGGVRSVEFATVGGWRTTLTGQDATDAVDLYLSQVNALQKEEISPWPSEEEATEWYKGS